MDSPDRKAASHEDDATHYHLGPARSFGGPIVDIVLPDGTKIRRVDEDVHKRALRKANETLGLIFRT